MLKELSKEFPGLKEKINGKKIVYLDNACSVLKMKSSCEAQTEYLLKYGSCAGKRSTHFLSQNAEGKFYEARKRIAGFIGAEPGEVVFVSGATEGFNLAANSFPFKNGDEVLLSALEHNSVFLPFNRFYAEKKIKLGIIPLKNFYPDFEKFKKMLNSRTRLLCLTASSNIFGGLTEYGKFIKEAKRTGCAVMLDCAQYAPTHRLDAYGTGADILAFSGHKLGAPFGTGVLYIKKDIMREMRSSKLGGGTVKNVELKAGFPHVELLQSQFSFEAGIQNYSGAFALCRAMELLNNAGYDKIRKHVSGLVSYAEAELGKIKEIKILGSGLERGALISFSPLSKKFSLPDFSLYMSEEYPGGVAAFRCGRLCSDLACLYSRITGVVRISFYVYNTEKDVNVFVSGLKKYIDLTK